MDTLNEKPFEHSCRNGTEVKAARCDFVGGVDLQVPGDLSDAEFAQDLFELGWYHAMNILPRLNGFTGMGIEYRVKRT